MSKLRLLAYGIAALVAVANFILVRFMLGMVRHILISGLADFSPTLNRGVSFSLLIQNSDSGRYALIAVLLVITVGVAIMAWRASSLLASGGLGLILGGALGNLSNRLQFHGAVFDFLALHLGKTPLFVCNFADIAISAGAVLLFADYFFVKQAAREFAD